MSKQPKFQITPNREFIALTRPMVNFKAREVIALFFSAEKMSEEAEQVGGPMGAAMSITAAKMGHDAYYELILRN